MFTEILRIKPILDRAAAASMEQSLTKRFKAVAERFGHGLKAVVKGTVIGISLALLAKILNPLQELEDKIKDLLGKGQDLRDLADRFNTTPGALQRLQNLAQAQGVKPEELRDELTKFAQAVEKARLELLDPTQEISPASRAVAQFIDQQDLAESFFKFTQQLKTFGNTAGNFDKVKFPLLATAYQKRIEGKPISEEERQALVQYQIANNKSGMDARRAVETEVFGAPTSGAFKRFINADQNAGLKNLGGPSTDKITAATSKLAAMADKRDLQQAQNTTDDYVKSANIINNNMLALMNQADKREEAFVRKQLSTLENLEKGAQAVTDMKESIQNLLNIATQLIGKLTFITGFLTKLTSTRWWNSIGGSKE